MTERLYLDDPWLLRFEAEVVATTRLAGRPAVVLTRTAFYPEGGGQPADRGSLGGVPVVDVQEVDGEILHALGGEAVPRGHVVGEIDEARRRDHLQQHHGQHLLSAAFEDVHGARTLSFHLGPEGCTIVVDLPVDRLGPGALQAVEAAANALVFADLEVTARERSEAELADLPLRKDPAKGSRVVVVRERGGRVADASPCGGTHPRRTGEVGAVAVLGAQRWGAGARVTFACGGRVPRLVRGRGEALDRTAEALRCAPAEVPAAAERLAEEATTRRKEVERLTLLLATQQADRLAANSPEPEAPVVAELTDVGGEAAPYLRAVASALSSRGRLVLLGAASGGRGFLCFARPREAAAHPWGKVDLGVHLRQAVALLDGKGGGAPDLAQGGGPRAERVGEALRRAEAAFLPADRGT